MKNQKLNLETFLDFGGDFHFKVKATLEGSKSSFEFINTYDDFAGKGKPVYEVEYNESFIYPSYTLLKWAIRDFKGAYLNNKSVEKFYEVTVAEVELEELNNDLSLLNRDKKKHETHTPEYRELLQKEIKLLEKQSELVARIK